MVEEILHTGIQNALSPEYLTAVLNLGTVRALQKQIERERREGRQSVARFKRLAFWKGGAYTRTCLC